MKILSLQMWSSQRNSTPTGGKKKKKGQWMFVLHCKLPLFTELGLNTPKNATERAYSIYYNPRFFLLSWWKKCITAWTDNTSRALVPQATVPLPAPCIKSIWLAIERNDKITTSRILFSTNWNKTCAKTIKVSNVIWASY